MAVKKIPLPSIAFVITMLVGCAGQRPTTVQWTPDPVWAPVDSLKRIGLYASALHRADSLREQSRVNSDWRTEFRAWVECGKMSAMVGRDMDSLLRAMRDRAGAAPIPLSQLLHSVLARAWWDRYQEERWTILERTELDTAFGTNDPATWTQGRYMREILHEAQASIEPFDTLRRIPVGDLGGLMSGDSAAAYLRPTLFDVLARRALTVFAHPETRITEPAWRFTLNEAAWFDLFEPFAWRKLEHRDSTAWEFQAMRTYQKLERMHLSDDSLDAYVDVALDRLAHVRAHSTLSNKDSLYLGALELLLSRVPDDPCSAEVMVAIARWHADQAGKYDRLAGDAWKWERRTARDLADTAIAKWPGSFGARNAHALRTSLARPSLSVRTGTGVEPDREFLAAVQYANTPRVWLRVVKDPPERNDHRPRTVDHGHALATQKPEIEWMVQLPDDGDLNEHLVELPVRGLPFGRYAILVCDTSSFRPGSDVIAYTNTYVTNMAFSDRSQGTDLDLLVLDRSSGVPRQGVKVTAFVRNPDYSHADRYLGLAEFQTNTEGMVRTNINGPRGEMRWELKEGDDVLLTDSKWLYNYGEGLPDSLRTFLFSDRVIYRPGQELLFKGLVTVKHGRETRAREGHAAQVYLIDANGERVDSLQYRSDAFGAFMGRFAIPAGRLTGYWRLDTDHGNKGFLVEEYKRPTFEAVFDPITTTPRLGDQATATGQAKSYAGAPLDGAQVKYAVKRSPRMPWWCGWGWRGLPWGQETEISSGEVACDAQGRFTIGFPAAADNAFPREADPSFVFTVEAWVTDISGETQTTTTSFVIGYRGIDLEIGLGSALDRSTADSLPVHVNNLNGERVDVPFDVRITRLLPPAGGVKRERLWDRPDRFVLQPDSFAARFPEDPRDNENDPMTWARSAPVLAHHIDGPYAGRIPLAELRDREVGTYLLEMEAREEGGRVVKAATVFSLYDPAIQHTGFENEAFHVQDVKSRCEPGEKAVFLLSSALPACRVLMEVERDDHIVVTRPFILHAGQQRVELPVLETDRGGFAVHFICVERGRVHTSTQWIDVPWSNKELKVEWMSFRDKLLPGAKEEWRLKISGPRKENVAAQLLATLYDASLDVFAMPDLSMDIWTNNDARRGWERSAPFGSQWSQNVHVTERLPGDSTRNYPDLEGVDVWSARRYRVAGAYDLGNVAEMSGEDGRAGYYTTTLSGDAMAGREGSEREKEENKPDTPAASPTAPLALRTNFRETAFFFPDLLTDHEGDVVLRFTMPDALTRWNFIGLAHTRSMQFAWITKSAVTQKPLMIIPNLPRFLRQGDRITITAKVNVMEGGMVDGTAEVELFDPATNKPISRAFRMPATTSRFNAAPGRSATASWTLQVPEGVDAVAVRLVASGAGMSDGEQRVLPILTDRVLVTESLPLAMTKAGTKTFTLEKLLSASSSTSRQHRSLTIEYTPNPAWYAVQALPYLMEFPHECAEQVFSRYYANHLAAHIVGERPELRKVFDAWRSGTPGNEGAFLSALEKAPDLKSILLEETPWVMNAKDEGERKRRVALLFDLQRMSAEEAGSLKKLMDMQLPNGAWPWWSGMSPSRYITQHIVAGFGHLHQLGAFDLDQDNEVQRMIRRAVDWLDKEADIEYERLDREQKNDTMRLPSSEDIHYLYARSCLPQHKMRRDRFSAGGYITTRARQYWTRYGMQEQAMIAIALHRLGTDDAPQRILTSLAERATMSEELGMYWKDFRAGHTWNMMPVETHALMIEAFDVVAHDTQRVNALRQYLLKLKQTSDWRTTKATADACYALLLTGSDWLEAARMPGIKVGELTVRPSAQEAGTGYFSQTWQGGEVKPAMGRVTVSTSTDAVQWGSLHWQYFERMDKVEPHESPFSLRRQLMLSARTDAGPRLVPLDTARVLKPGDKITVRIELRTDRHLDYVHLKDLRAAGLEPVGTISGYRWEGGLGYYQSIRDAAAHFFFDRLSPGTYVFEYDLKVTHAGEFSAGIASAQCMYAPEFSSHSEGVRLAIGDR